MKKEPYKEVINIKEEKKEYGRLCRGVSKEFRVYSDWKEHIKQCLLAFRTEKDLNNFKRYCINIDRGEKRLLEMIINYICMLIPIYFLFYNEKYKMISFFSIVVGVFCVILLYNHMITQITRESYFYQDLLEIICEIEKERATAMSEHGNTNLV